MCRLRTRRRHANVSSGGLRCLFRSGAKRACPPPYNTCLEFKPKKACLNLSYTVPSTRFSYALTFLPDIPPPSTFDCRCLLFTCITPIVHSHLLVRVRGNHLHVQYHLINCFSFVACPDRDYLRIILYRVSGNSPVIHHLHHPPSFPPPGCACLRVCCQLLLRYRARCRGCTTILVTTLVLPQIFHAKTFLDRTPVFPFCRPTR